jgi:hypothetical protein
MSDATVKKIAFPNTTVVVNVADVEAHVAMVKAGWRQHERTMTWEQKIETIERMRERDAQLARARECITGSI